VYLPGGLQLSLLDEDNQLRCYCIDRGTEGRKTGVIDFEGTPVWEGDIVVCTTLYGDRIVDEVRYAPGRFILAKSGLRLSDFANSNDPNRRLVVIGNVHDHPERLEANK
jgi:hypothetical protein